jgi:hypothetical protein
VVGRHYENHCSYLEKDVERHGWEQAKTFLSGACHRGLLTRTFFRLLHWPFFLAGSAGVVNINASKDESASFTHHFRTRCPHLKAPSH